MARDRRFPAGMFVTIGPQGRAQPETAFETIGPQRRTRCVANGPWRGLTITAWGRRDKWSVETSSPLANGPGRGLAITAGGRKDKKPARQVRRRIIAVAARPPPSLLGPTA